MQESLTDEIGGKLKLKVENTNQKLKSMKCNWEKKGAQRDLRS